MIEIHYLVLIAIIFGAFLVGYITAALLAAGRAADLEQENRFYQDMLLIKEQTIK